MRHIGWIRLVGSLKKKVSFAEYRLFYRALFESRVTSLVHVCDMTFIRETRLIRLRDVTRSYVCQASFVCVT